MMVFGGSGGTLPSFVCPTKCRNKSNRDGSEGFGADLPQNIRKP